MDKQSLINGIATDLVQLGTPFTYDQGADLTIEATFTEGKTSSGPKKMTFLASVFFNETEGIVYYWEQTKTQKSGFSLNTYEDDATMLSSQKIVTSQIYDPNGNIVEYQLYVNQISKAIKSRVEQNGLHFKMVLQRAKASYPVGGPVASHTSIMGERSVTVGSDSVTKSAGAGMLYWILYSIIFILALVVGFVGGVSLAGMAIIIGLALLLLLAGLKGVIKGVVMTLGAWALIAVVLIFVIGSFAPSTGPSGSLETDTKTEGSTVANNQQSNTTQVASKDEKPMFAITGVRTSSTATSESRVVNSESEYKPFAVFTSFLDFQSMGPVGEPASNLKKLLVHNFKVTQGPSKGKVSYFVEFTLENTDYTAYTSLESYEHEFNESVYSSMMSITLHTMVTDVSDFFTLNQSTISSDEILGKVATWEELKFTFEYDIEAITETGDRYVKHMVMDLPQGDFIFNPSDNAYSEVMVDMVNDIGSDLFIKQ